MKRALLLAVAGLGAFAGCAHALAAATTQANVSIEVQQAAAGIDVVSPLLIPAVSTSIAPLARVTATSTGVPTSLGRLSGGAGGATNAAGPLGPSVGNATLTIYGQSGDAVSMAVPETFKVIRTGGTETLTVKTNTNSEYDLGGNGVVLGGGQNADTMSVNVGGALALASADKLTPGPYEGLLVVVVQYN